MVAKRGKTVIPYDWETQHSRIPIDPAILAAIGHRFMGVGGGRKLKMQMRWSEATRVETSNGIHLLGLN